MEGCAFFSDLVDLAIPGKTLHCFQHGTPARYQNPDFTPYHYVDLRDRITAGQGRDETICLRKRRSLSGGGGLLFL